MNDDNKISVMLAGPYPKSNGMKGTYGRIIENILSSSIFKCDIDFKSHHATLPADGPYVKRIFMDMIRFILSMLNRPDIFHIIMQKYRALYREYPMIMLSKIFGIRTVIDIRAGTLQYMMNRENHKLQHAMMDTILKNADAIVVECKKDTGYIRGQYDRKALYLPNVVLKDDFDRVIPANLNIGPDRPVRLIYSGRYIKEKGILTVLRGLDVLSSRRRKVEFHLSGSGNDNMVKAEIGRYSANPPEGMSVIDHRHNLPDPLSLLSSAHIFVMPTTWKGEGHPLSLTEAMMAGLGMILCDWLHLSDLIPEEGAIIVPPDNPEAFADAVEKYIDSPDYLLKAGETNRRYVKEHYLDTVCYPSLLNLWKAVVGKKEKMRSF